MTSGRKEQARDLSFIDDDDDDDGDVERALNPK